MNDTVVRPRVWVGCLGHYNEGHLLGEWFDAADAPTEMNDWAAVSASACSNAEHEELWVFDHEGIGESGEFSPMRAVAWGELFERVGEHQWAAFTAWAASGSHVTDGEDLPDVSSFEDAYAGEWDSERDFAQDEDGAAGGLFEGLDEDHPAVRYFDWQTWERDLFMFDYWSAPAPGGGVFVFRNL